MVNAFNNYKILVFCISRAGKSVSLSSLRIIKINLPARTLTCRVVHRAHPVGSVTHRRVDRAPVAKAATCVRFPKFNVMTQ